MFERNEYKVKIGGRTVRVSARNPKQAYMAAYAIVKARKVRK